MTKHLNADERIIHVKLVQTNVFTRWPCAVCGGHTEKVPVLAEAEVTDEGQLLPPVRPSNPMAGFMAGFFRQPTVIRVCERCLRVGDIDAQLKRRAEELEMHAREMKGLVGRLRVPTYAEWKARMEREEVAEFAAYSMGSCHGDWSDVREAEYNSVLRDDVAFEAWRQCRDDYEKRSVGQADDVPF